jgi:hypothetical protein
MPGSKVFSSFSSRSRTRSAISTVFLPDCLITSKVTASSPFTRTRVRISAKPSVTRATSRRRTADPSRAVATTSSRTESTAVNSPTARTLISRAPSP